MEGLGAGLAALAFWLFAAAVIVAGIWDKARKRDAQHETLRRLIESGKPVDEALLAKLLGSRIALTDHVLGIVGIVVLSLAPGVAILAWFVGQDEREALLGLTGVAGLLACFGIGLLVASRYARRSKADDEAGYGSPPESH
jgi:hypothetical protein